MKATSSCTSKTIWMTPKEARRQALIKLGGVEQTKENTATVGPPRLETLLQDIRFGPHMLRKKSRYKPWRVGTLALGIGGTTAIFTLVQQVMLRSLAVAKPEQLWRVGDAVACCYSNGYTQGDGNWLPQNDWSFFSCGKRTNCFERIRYTVEDLGVSDW